ncbi:hypothetical protein J6590_007327 [Homalodisca vitripennis]|nr:hypothetical protein J6590_007327 [Homalodisca vitripennis]
MNKPYTYYRFLISLKRNIIDPKFTVEKVHIRALILANIHRSAGNDQRRAAIGRNLHQSATICQIRTDLAARRTGNGNRLGESACGGGAELRLTTRWAQLCDLVNSLNTKTKCDCRGQMDLAYNYSVVSGEWGRRGRRRCSYSRKYLQPLEMSRSGISKKATRIVTS